MNERKEITDMDIVLEECAKPADNKYVLTFNVKAQAMSDTNYKQVNYERNGMKVRLEFPKEPQNTETITQEVKEILVSTLKEQLKKT